MAGRRGDRRAKTVAEASLLAGIAVGLVGNLATGTVAVSGAWVPTMWVATALLVVVAGMLLWMQQRPRPQDPQALLDQAINAIGAQVRRQWEHEAVVRGLRQPLPLRVNWSSTQRPVAAAREVVVDDEQNVTWEECPLVGDTSPDVIVARFRGLQHRQLVVLGEAGAGKSVLALLLTLGLLADPVEGEPIPVLLPIAGWHPGRESVTQFVARRLAEDYPDTVGGADGRAMAERLVERGRLLPVLDGLDEIAALLHALAVRRLDEHAARGGPLVVTCRSREYDHAVHAEGRIMSRAAVVEIQPVSTGEAIAFLSHPAVARARWQQVFTHLNDEPGGVLAGVLSTPLMVSLARAAYQPPHTDPGELMRATGRQAVQAMLIDAFVTSVHDRDQSAPPIGPPLRPYRPQIAHRYLQTLALNMNLTATVELVWWQLRPDLFTRHARRAPALLAVVLTVLAGLAGTLLLGGREGIVTAIVVSSALAVAAAGWLRPVWPHNHPAHLPAVYLSTHTRQGLVRMGRVVVGVWCGLLTGVMVGDASLTAAVVLASGLCMPLLPTDRIKPRLRGAPPGATMRAHHRATLGAAALHALPAAVIVAGTAALTGTPSSRAAAMAALFVYGWTAACPAGLWTWLRYRAIHVHLAIRRWLPLRLNAFLHDQHRRGTLRQTGTTWQIRHLILQQHLADQALLHHLSALADDGDGKAARRLADLLVQQGRTVEAIAVLRALANGGDGRAARRLAGLLTRAGRTEEGIAVLRALATYGGWPVGRRLAWLLSRAGRTEEAVDVLQALAGRGDWDAPRRLAELLTQQGRTEDAVDVLRDLADQGNRYAAQRLADLLVQDGRVDELRARADDGDLRATRRLADLLVQERRVDELRVRASHGDQYAAQGLVDLLVQDGRIEEAVTFLRGRADGDIHDTESAWRLVDLLVQDGRTEEAQAFLLARADHEINAARRLADLLVQQGRTEDAIAVLRPLADRGDWSSAEKVADLLVRQGGIEEAVTFLRAHADDHSCYFATQALADLLVQQGRAEEAIAFLRIRVDHDDYPAARRLADLLIQQGRTEEAHTFLRARADHDIRDTDAAPRLADLLVQEGRTEEAVTFLRARADDGDAASALGLADLLVHQGRAEEAIAFLSIWVDHDDHYPTAQRLADLLVQEGRTEEAVTFLRAGADDGDAASAYALADLLVQKGWTEEAAAFLRLRADHDEDAARRLADLLVQEGRTEEAVTILRTLADDGDGNAARQLAKLAQGGCAAEEP